ncbi:hypothetical protein PS15m_008677 [Mucor circinelloides]
MTILLNCMVLSWRANSEVRALDYDEPIFGSRGDTKPKECKDNGFNCKIDLRVTTNAAKHIDLSAAEYAKKPGTSKYYKDKLKLVLSGFLHLRKYIK